MRRASVSFHKNSNGFNVHIKREKMAKKKKKNSRHSGWNFSRFDKNYKFNTH